MSLLACSHGTSSPHGQRAVSRLVDAVDAALPGTTVRAAFVDVEQPDVPTALAELATDDVRVVPLLLSAGFHVYVDLTEAVARHAGAVLTPALGPDPRLVDLLVRRLAQVGLAEGDAVVMAAAGSSDARAVRDCESTAAMLAEAIGRPVTIGYLSAATPPLVDAVAAARGSGARVVVSTYLLAPGYFADLTRHSGADVVTEPLLTADGDTPEEVVAVVVDRAETSRH